MSEQTEQELVQRARAILEQVKYPDADVPEGQRYCLRVTTGHGGVYLQAAYMEGDVVTGRPAIQQTRKWLLSPHMTDSEIVQTAFKLCLTSAEHRCREAFTYRGRRIFGPHFDVEDLVRLCADGKGGAGARPASPD